ncbi:hypothetical protein Tco_0717391 [Tanacetum coccineum]
MTPRSGLRWKPTGKIFKTVGLRWVPTGKIFISSTTKVDSDPTNGSNEDITNQYECEQTLDVSAGTLNLSAGLAPPRQMTSDHNSSELGIHGPSYESCHVQSVPKLFLQQTRQIHHDKSICPMIQPEPEGSTQGHSIVRLEMNVYKGRMPTKIELTLEQSQQGVSNDVLVSIEGVEE